MQNNTNNTPYIIVGAGLAGCVLAERIANEKKQPVLLIEERNHIGGNCFDEKSKDESYYIHTYGPHLFHTNDKDIFSYLSQFTTWIPYEHAVLTHIKNKNVPIPFNLNTLEMTHSKEGADTLKKILLERYGNNAVVSITDLKKNNNPSLKNLSEFIYTHFFENYSKKQWGEHFTSMDIENVLARVPIRTNRDNRYFSDTYQCMPKDGFTSLFKKLTANPLITLHTGKDAFDSLSIKGNTLYWDEKLFAGTLIYTGKIDRLFNYKHGHLPYRSLRLEFEEKNMKFFQGATVVNYPNDNSYTRITEFKHIYKSQYPSSVILREYPENHIPGENTPYYPIPGENNEQIYDTYRKEAQNIPNLLLVGRLAEYKYYNMDDVIKKALKLFESL